MRKALLFLGKLLLAIALVVGIIAFATSVGAVQYVRPQSTELVLCYYAREARVVGDYWLMRVPRNECVGWTPI